MRRIGLAVVLFLTLFLGLTARAQQIERQTFGEWTARCEVDKMTDAKKCFVYSRPLYFGFSNGRLELVFVGTKHHPGSQVMLRIDNEPPLSVKEPGFTGGQAADILKLVAANAQRIRTRHQEWPGKFVESELSPTGFAEALAYVRSVGRRSAPIKGTAMRRAEEMTHANGNCFFGDRGNPVLRSVGRRRGPV
jgi:hypothetical protein